MKKILFSTILAAMLLLSGCGSTETPSEFTSPTPKDGHTKGNVYAPVVITEYANFACPACANAVALLDTLMVEMKGQIAVTYAHFPFALHGFTEEQIMKLHNATECAADQGKFWEMHNKLYEKETGEGYGPDKLSDYAKEVGLDMAKFEPCNKDMVHKAKIEKIRDQGKAFGVSSTPTFFINDALFSFSQNSKLSAIDELKIAIKKAQEAKNAPQK